MDGGEKRGHERGTGEMPGAGKMKEGSGQKSDDLESLARPPAIPSATAFDKN